ncbi:Smr/MutS family protein [Rickettsiella grylli]|uniref:Smr protein/MutS2 n=1 Tax=Rickettsiella grylli TaxID=59196 RepID=A8PP67_9COXI|nr:Smr/MutS family protein [Rickettsiella grylli]EDP46529.1 Smr protein/MutS2 [Rickettsiella grylli]OIZ98309.1 hypothetical protein BEV13_06845 [Rickettsiella grylli]
MNKSRLDKEDWAFFKEVMKDVKRTPTVHVNPKPKKNSPKRTRLIDFNDENRSNAFILRDPTELNITSDEPLFFNRPGVQNKRLKQLTRGDIRPSNCLDLHQMTVNQARFAVYHFLLQSQKYHYTCVRIIHGKGKFKSSGAKLKNHVYYWLPQISWVLAFSSAQARDGGTGAVYVLLRRIRASADLFRG